MKRKTGSMFTSKSQSDRGMMSTALGILSFVSLIAAVAISFSGRGETPLRLGSVGLLAVIISISGLVIGILSLMEKDKYPLFPWGGVVFNGLSLAAWAFIIYIGI